jgi:hypothetical protein
MISEPPHRGGLTVDEGVSILVWFIRQNGALIKRFLEDQTRELWVELEKVLDLDKKTEEKMDPSEDSPGLKPSSIISPDTQESG